MDNNYNSILSKFAVIVVLYKTPLKKSKTFISLSNNVLDPNLKIDLIVYDNSPTSVFEGNVDQGIWRLKYYHDPSNPGVSKAYNLSAKYASEIGKKWLLLTDQDTTFPKNSLITYAAAVNEYRGQKVFAPILKASRIISPSLYLFKRGFHPKSITVGLQKLKYKSPVNSGVLVELKMFTKLGGYKNEIKLDFSDFYFFEKVKKLHPYFVVLSLTCHHEMSTNENVTWKSSSIRHKFYCEGAYQFSKTVYDITCLSFFTFLRSAKLVLKFKKLIFFKIWLEKWFFHD